MNGKILKRKQDWIEHPKWKGLNLIQQHNTICDAVQFAAWAFVIGKKRFKELHTCRDNDGSFPVLTGLPMLLRLPAGIERTVVFDYSALGNRGKDLPTGSDSLLKNAGVRDHDDDPLEPVKNRMMKRKAQSA